MTPREIVLEQIHHHTTKPVPYTLYFEEEVEKRLDQHYGDQMPKLARLCKNSSYCQGKTL